MTQALAVRGEFSILREPEAVLAEAGSEGSSLGERLAGLFEEYDHLRQSIETLAGTVADMPDDVRGTLITCLIENIRDRHYSGWASERLFGTEKALKRLDAIFWDKAITLTDVLEIMPENRRHEWWEMIHEATTIPFERATVLETLSGLLGSRESFFAERVEGLFFGLSSEHKTNRPQGFGQRMILSNVYGSFGMLSRHESGYVLDLLKIAARFRGEPEPTWCDFAEQILKAARVRHGEWHSVNGGAFRLRAYIKGTVHIEVHPDFAWRLNAVLASRNPRALASDELARPPKKRSREWVTMQRPLPAEILSTIAAILRDTREREVEEYSLLPYADLLPEARAVLEHLGAEVGKAAARFPYPANSVLREVLISGCLPDGVTHQYYPTREAVAKLAIEAARVEPEHSVLEPSAGTGGIADHLPNRERVTAVELAPLYAKILTAKGFRALRGDFLEWTIARGEEFDRVVMNPPFSQGRALAHLGHAAGMVKIGGRIACILPASYRGKALAELSGFDEIEWSDPITGEFERVSIAVAIVSGRRFT